MGKINEQQIEIDFTGGDNELVEKVLNYDGKVPYMKSLKQRLQSGEELTEKDKKNVGKYFDNPSLYEESTKNNNIITNIKNFDKLITSIYNNTSEHFGYNSFGEWLYKSNGLNLMSVIEGRLSLNAERYTPIKDQDLLRNTFKGVEILSTHPTYGKFIEKVGKDSYLITPTSSGRNKIKIIKDSNNTFITDFRFYHNDEGKWHQINKLNTNGSDLILLIKTIVTNHKELFIGIEYQIKDVETLKKFLVDKKDKIIDFINGLDEDIFLNHTETSTKNTISGEYIEDLVINKIKSDWGLNDSDVWSGGNGDIIDMLLGVDIIFKDGNDWKTVQVKKDIRKWENRRPVQGKVDISKLFNGRYKYVDLGAGSMGNTIEVVDKEGNFYKPKSSNEIVEKIVTNFIDTGKI